MKVFLSSVERGLKEERANVAALLEATGHEAQRFETFGALDKTSRVACLGAVADADVYLLLLGPHYGSVSPDTGLSATEEEFNAARQHGRPRLVFKQRGIAMEPAQAEFAARVGSYVDGRFWAEFTGLADLGPAVLKAIAALDAEPAEPVWRAVSPRDVPVVHDSRGRRIGAQLAYTNVLEVHVLPIESVGLRPASTQDSLRTRMVRVMRTTGLLADTDPIEDLSGSGVAHVRRPSAPRTSASSSASSITTDPYCGLRVTGTGPIVAYSALPSDTMGGLANEEELARVILLLLDQILPFVPPDTADVAVTTVLADEGRVLLGDPSQLGHRTSATVGFGRGDLVLPADRAISREALMSSPQTVARELAARLAQELRER